MDLDIVQWGLLIFGTCLLLPAGFFLGRFLDISWRASQLKRLLKKDYIIFNLRQKDKKTFKQVLIAADTKAVIFNNNMWVLLADRVYNQKTPNMGFSLKSTNTNIYSSWGIPIVFVDGDSMEPLAFNDIMKPPSAEEAGAAQNAWDLNQRAKNLSGVQMIQTLIMIGILLGAVAAGLGFMNMNALNDMKTQLSAIQGQVNETQSSPHYSNDGTLIVTQPKG
jgi:hypothetical protein